MFEYAFAAYLLFFLPAQQVWKSLRPKKAKPDTLTAVRYLKSIRWIASLLLVLLLVMALSDRRAADIGLDVPVSLYGQWGFVFVVALVLIGLIWDAIVKRTAKAKAHQDEFRALIKEDDFIPRTRSDLALFVVLSLLLGIGWELLYRGFLMLVLTPVTGTAGAVILAAVAYGVGHGYNGMGKMSASIVSALLFTFAYVLTGSLWWLILLHVLLPLSMGLSGYRVFKSAPAAAEAAEAG